MAKRSKRLKKKILGLRKQKEKHKIKLETEEGRKDTTPDYWEKEIKQFQKQIDITEEKLKKLKEK